MSDKYENTVMAAELDEMQEKFRNLLDKNQKLNDNLKFATTQYNEVVEQNKSLQGELIKIKNEVLKDPLSIREFFLMRCIEDEYENGTRKKIVDFLTEMSSQNNRGTAFPYIYTIADEHEHYEEDDSGTFVYDSDAGKIVSIAEILKSEFREGNIELEESEALQEIIDDIGQSCEDDRINDWLHSYIDGGFQRYSKEYETYYEGTFFTKTDAEEYLASTMNHHFGPNPRTYVDSMNKWGRTSKTTEFLTDIFNYFGVKIPPEMYYEKKKEAEEAAKAGNQNE